MKMILFISLLLAMHTLVHELGHYVCATMLNLKVLQIQLGISAWNILKIKTLCLSPVLLGGYVEVARDELLKLPVYKRFLYFEAGCLGTVWLLVLLNLFLRGQWLYVSKTLGVLLITTNQIPFGRTDLSVFISLLRE